MNNDPKNAYKVIRDSVHGNIELKKSLVEYILDTKYFQRLRRIEQTSVRAIYPCARHDRFTHSLGVYHVGTKIVNHFESQFDEIKGLDSHQAQTITNSYQIACLLHDIAHAPFSHTFESYYGDKSVLYKKLCEKFDNKELIPDRLQIAEIKQHEYASAILVFDKFKDPIQSPNALGGDVELVCRMIIGAPYKENSIYYQVCNCFINLLHGEVDADRLDYACRDVWSSGYKSVSVDVNRVIHAMQIKKYNDVYKLCFSHNVIGDIRNIMELKRFQVSHIFNHHTIVYDQALLVQAAETMAAEYFTDITPQKALQNIVCLEAVENEKSLVSDKGTHLLKLLGDDDLYFLIKQNNNKYFEELSSRTYKRFALWKSPEEFYTFFPFVDKSINITAKTFLAKVKRALKPLMGDLEDNVDILTREVTYKQRANIDDLFVVVHGQPKPYCEVCHEIFKETSGLREFNFTYLYIPKPKIMALPDDIEKIRKRAIDYLKPVVKELFKTPTTSQDILTMLKTFIREFDCKVDITKDTFTKREVTQLEKVLKRIKTCQDEQIQKVATEWLALIIDTYKKELNAKQRKTKNSKTPANKIISQKDIFLLNQEDE